MRNYHRLLLGEKSKYAKQCFEGNFVGTNYDVGQDISKELVEDWREFNAKFRSIYIDRNPGKTMIGAGIACGALWTFSKGVKIGDILLCPDGSGTYRIAEVTGNYQYNPDSVLMHQRPVRWIDGGIERALMSKPLKNSSGGPLTIVYLSNYAEEIEALLGGSKPSPLVSNDPEIEDPYNFALEKHLEDFLVENWSQTELGKEYEIYQEDGEVLGQQYPSDTGPIDVLAVSKDNKRLLVVELKRGKASDSVVGQILRYMSYVREEIAEEGQEVKGVIIALEDDPRLKRAISMVPDISFYRYQVSFKLVKATS